MGSQDAAVAQCAADGARLAMFKTQEEYEIVREYRGEYVVYVLSSLTVRDVNCIEKVPNPAVDKDLNSAQISVKEGDT